MTQANPSRPASRPGASKAAPQGDFMKHLFLIGIFALSGCSSIQTCGTREYSFEVPNTVPFLNGAFKIKRSSDHVDCERDPEERAIQDD